MTNVNKLLNYLHFSINHIIVNVILFDQCCFFIVWKLLKLFCRVLNNNNPLSSAILYIKNNKNVTPYTCFKIKIGIK